MKVTDIRDRLGKISIPEKTYKNLDQLRETLQDVYIVSGALNQESKCFLFVACSTHFQPLRSDEPVPEYLLLFNNHNHRLEWQAKI
jgi:hypothetical protein